jgi:hypothetical protein
MSVGNAIAWGIARSPRSGILGSNLISDSSAAIFFVTGNHNKTEVPMPII